MRRNAATAVAILGLVAITACGGSDGGEAPAEPSASCPVAAPADLVSSGTLTVGMNLGAPPQNFVDSNNKPTGFDVDFAKALAKQMCLKVKIANSDFAGLFPALNAEKFDVLISRINITPERQQSFDFIPYFKAGLIFLAAKDFDKKLATEADACGYTVGAIAGGAQVADLNKASSDCTAGKKITVKTFPSNPEALQQVNKGTIQLLFTDWAYLTYTAEHQSDKFALVSPVLSGHGPGTPRDQEGICMRKGDADMSKAMRAAFDKVKSNGEYEQLLEKWNVESAKV